MIWERQKRPLGKGFAGLAEEVGFCRAPFSLLAHPGLHGLSPSSDGNLGGAFLILCCSHRPPELKEDRFSTGGKDAMRPLLICKTYNELRHPTVALRIYRKHRRCLLLYCGRLTAQALEQRD